MEWFQELYDDFRQRTGFGSLPEDRTRRDVDLIISECAVRPGGRVLDLCSGIGRHSVELEHRGIHAVGFELNPAYVDLAKERAIATGVSPTFHVGDVRFVDFGADFDAAILMWQSFGYFTDQEDEQLLGKVRNALRSGGRFLIEILSREFLVDNFAPTSERELDGIRVVEERKYDPSMNRIRSVITRYEASQVVRRQTDWRVYSASELKEMAEAVGLVLLSGYGDLDGAPLTRETRLMRLVFERGSR